MGNAEKCPCSIINKIFTSADEVINITHSVKAENLGASEECILYIINNVGKTAKDVFPSCFKPKLIFETNPTGVSVYVDDSFVGVT